MSNLEQHSKGATLPAVLLKQDGTAVEVSFDTTPRLKEVNRIVGCDAHENITFAGQWEDVVDEGDSVLLILRGKAEDLNLPANKNKLQPPFHEAEIPGDILLQRSDEEGNGVCYSSRLYPTCCPSFLVPHVSCPGCGALTILLFITLSHLTSPAQSWILHLSNTRPSKRRSSRSGCRRTTMLKATTKKKMKKKK